MIYKYRMEVNAGRLFKSQSDYFNVATRVWGMKIVFVNVYIIATGEGNNWILVDAGLKGSADKIIRMAKEIFGVATKPKAIILTHGHFDHVGALQELSDRWHVPIYAHPLEMPYLKGMSSYPPPDPFVGGGLMSLMSCIYPRRPKNMGRRVFKLPVDGTVPGLPDWKYIFTPGHSPGHISLFRESDKTMISGDAFVSTKQESATAVIVQKKQVNGPPKYFTTDWIAAEASVKELASLNPEVAATGHGLPLHGEELRHGLTFLAENFKELAVPKHGRYVDEPAISDERGVVSVPPAKVRPAVIAGALIIGSIIAFTTIFQLKGRKLI